jgi:PhnB protein
VGVRPAAAAADWYRRAFGAEESQRVDLPDGPPLFVALAIGSSEFHIAGEFPDAGILSPLSIGGTATVLQIAVPDADAAWARAVEAGAEVVEELADKFWGERHGQLRDPFGHKWNLAQRLREVSVEEMERTVAEMFGSS